MSIAIRVGPYWDSDDLDAFEFEYDRPKSIGATVDGDPLLFIPREIPAETQEPDAGVDGDPC